MGYLLYQSLESPTSNDIGCMYIPAIKIDCSDSYRVWVKDKRFVSCGVGGGVEGTLPITLIY